MNSTQIDFRKRSIIVIGRDGELLQPDGSSSEISSSEFSNYFDSILKELETLPGKKNLLLFVHGGLNGYSTSLKRANQLTKPITDAGYYPIFVNWRSGLFDCYLEHLLRIRQGRTHRKFGWITWLYLLFADLGRALFRFPAALYLQVINDFKPYTPNLNPDWLNSITIFTKLRKRYEKSMSSGNNSEIGVSLGPDLRSTSEKWCNFILLLISYPVKVVSGAVIDAFGTSAWGNMLRRTKTLFRSPEEFDIRDKLSDEAEVEKALDTASTGPLALFLSQLSQMVKVNPNSYEITLIGHSMGTIVLNRLLKDFTHLPCTNIVYMAAACSIQEFVDSALPYMEKNSKAQFFNLCLHPVAETAESNACEIAPRGSLLVWIDNFLSSPETTPDRRLGVWENTLQTTHMIPRHLRGRINFKAFAVGKTAGIPQKHTDFDDVEFWKPEFWKIDV